jgi:transposase InsO family protein
VTQDDLLYRFRLRTFAMAAELGNVRAACRAMGIHPSTYYRWKRLLDRYGPEILRPRERRVPRMANATSVLVEQRVVAFALGHPGFGPARIAAELAQPRWGGIRLSTNGVWRVLRRHGLSTRARRYGLVAGYAAPPAPERPPPAPEQHLQVSRPGGAGPAGLFLHRPPQRDQGHRVAVHRHRRRLRLRLATLQVTRRNPSVHWTSALARTVAADLAARGWKLERVLSDNASEFRSATFTQTIAELGARQSFIRAGRPQTNGCVERVQQTILEECWKPAFARYLIPKQTGLRLDLERYLHSYNTERAHTGRWTKGRTPDEVLGKAKLWHKNH